MTTPAANLTIELRLPIDVGEEPLGYDDHDGCLAVEVLLAGGGYLTLVLPAEGARAWAGELFGAVTIAHREATGDPHALTDLELADLGDPEGYDPEPGLFLRGGSDGQPARLQFHVLVDVQGQVLSAGHLRAAIVACLTENLNAAHVAVTAGEPVAGTPI